MKNLFTLFLALAWLPFSLMATEVTVTGKVFFGAIEEPVSDYLLSYRVLAAPFMEDEILTNSEGEFTLTLDLDFTATPEIPVMFEVFDFCNGFMETRVIIVNEDGVQGGELDFYICLDIFPPPPPEGCEAYFAYDQIEASPYIVQFHDLSYSSGPVDSWAWEFGDGATSSEPAPVHEYDTTGEYTVTLTITADTCSSTIVMPVHIANFGPCDCGGDFNPVCVISPDGEVITLPNACFAECLGFGPDTFVDCGDCDCTFDFDPVCVLGDDGEEIAFPNACWAECEGYTSNDFVDCQGPADCPCPTYFDPVCVLENGDTLQFDNPCFAECEGYGPDDYFFCAPAPCNCGPEFEPVCVFSPDGVVFLFPNACIAECEGFSPDDFVDCDTGGYEDCIASFYYEFDLQSATTLSFFDDSFAFEGDVISWQWDFGDGNASDEQNPVHQYAADGIYEVSLAITTSAGCTSTTVQHICVGEGGVFPGPDCQAMFFFEQGQDDLNTFAFFDLSFGTADSWSWDFGDGNTSDEQNPVHTYADAGTYFVTLTITAGDCESTMAMLLFTADDIWYNDACNALFLPLVIPDSNQVFFLNLSSPDAVSFEWDFGDGGASTEFMVGHQYATGGSYNVSLTITTANGCTSTFTVTLNLNGNGLTGTPAFTLLNSAKDEPLTAGTAVKAYPNPVSSELAVQLTQVEAGSYQLQLWTMNGQMVKQDFHELPASDKQTLLLNLDGLPAGLYWLKVQQPSGVQTLKIVKE
ncbi:MAG: PKD domain-containing protein [Lewinellaceae bacterium]|nr:PKD domain-containing protein [Phaeodactylibacter sp.]MCB0615210.1 PKD domain-containing protein [Phaeodactylibacter sp.]MCB9349452.1 PKD domain-containing protein [Lewinellaceae bacterium]